MKKQTTIYIDEELLKKVRKKLIDEGKSLTKKIEELLIEYIEKEEK